MIEAIPTEDERSADLPSAATQRKVLGKIDRAGVACARIKRSWNPVTFEGDLMENLKIEAKANPAFPENDPRYHTARVKQILQGLVDHLREDASKIDEPKSATLV